MFTHQIELLCLHFAAWRSSIKLESGLNSYYERWEEVSGRITNALSGIKTVKLSGAEKREVHEFKNISDLAYANYVDRSLASNTYTFWQGVLTHLSTALVLGYGGYSECCHYPARQRRRLQRDYCAIYERRGHRASVFD